MNPALASNGTTSNIGQYLTAFSIHSVTQFFPEIWSILVIVAVVIAFFLLVIGGIQWIVAQDDKEKLAAARSRVTMAVIGLLIVLVAWVIAGLFMNLFHFPEIFTIPGTGSGGPGGGGNAGWCYNEVGEAVEECYNINKCNIAGICDEACCATDADCEPKPPDYLPQSCSISNGYCVKGKSCWPSQ